MSWDRREVDDWLRIDPGAEVTLRNCTLAPAVFDRFEDVSRQIPHILTLVGCRTWEIDESEQPRSKGRLLVNKLMVLARKMGHDEYAVYRSKLRGLTPTTSMSFEDALHVLERHNAVTTGGNMVFLTQAAEDHRYAGKPRNGLRNYSDVAEFWDPIVAELDAVL